MPKFKPNKGLLKRVKITGKGKIKFHGGHSGHLRSHKTGAKLRHLRRKKVAKAGDIGRLEKMLGRPLLPG
jgi:large subunit ribosomal protein L35